MNDKKAGQVPSSLPKAASTHTAGSDTIFVQIYMEALPGVPAV